MLFAGVVHPQNDKFMKTLTLMLAVCCGALAAEKADPVFLFERRSTTKDGKTYFVGLTEQDMKQLPALDPVKQGFPLSPGTAAALANVELQKFHLANPVTPVSIALESDLTIDGRKWFYVVTFEERSKNFLRESGVIFPNGSLVFIVLPDGHVIVPRLEK